MITRLLSAHKNKLFFAAVSYTVVLTYFCLETPDKPIDIISQSDKIIHALAYFVFTISWFVATFSFVKVSQTKHLTFIFLWALVYGIIVELLQHYCTLTRQADINDIYANVLGAFIAIVALKFILTKTVKS